MATRIKLEVIFSVTEGSASSEMDRLHQYMKDYRVVNRSRSDPVPHYASLNISREVRTWDIKVSENPEWTP